MAFLIPLFITYIVLILVIDYTKMPTVHWTKKIETSIYGLVVVVVPWVTWYLFLGE